MLKAMGLNTGKIYAEGRVKADILRKLHAEFPSFEEADSDRVDNVLGRKRMKAKTVLPEPIKIFEFT